jgi:short-subunit dehydrogenase
MWRASDAASPRHVVVTGASSGIGEAIALEFLRSGAHVTLIARRREKLMALAAEHNGKASVRVQDLSDPDHAADFVDEVVAENGPIDVLVNNAGIENTGLMLTSDAAAARTLLQTNLLSPLVLMRHVTPQMADRGHGTIVNVASVAALAPLPMQAWYAASKSGFATFSETARVELRGTGVNIVTVYPGPVTTPMADVAYEKFGGRKGLAGMFPEGRPDVLARLVRRAVALRRARIVYPRFYWLGWYLPPLSRFLANRVVKMPAAVEHLGTTRGSHPRSTVARQS